MPKKITIPSSKVTINIEDWGIEINDDLMDLIADISVAREGKTDDEAFSQAVCVLLNKRWEPQLKGNKLTLGKTYAVLRPLMEEFRDVKKNIENTAK